MSSSSVSEPCYLCGVSQGTITVAATNIVDLMETICKRAIATISRDMVCEVCVNLFHTMANTNEKSVTDKAFKLMREKLAKMRVESAMAKAIPGTPRFNCSTCDYKTFNLDDFPLHSCKDQIKSFTIDFIKGDSKNQEKLFQELLVDTSQSVELKSTMVVDGVERDVLAVLDLDGNVLNKEDKEEVLQAIADGTNKDLYYLKQKSSDEEN